MANGKRKYPMAIIVPAAFQSYEYFVKPLMNGQTQTAATNAQYAVGWSNGKFDYKALSAFWFPIALGYGIHKVAAPRINKYIPGRIGV